MRFQPQSQFETLRQPAPGAFERFDLFDNPVADPVPGLSYWPDFITPEQGARLLESVDAHAWRAEYQRRTQSFGPGRYASTGQSRPPLPQSLLMLARKLTQSGIFDYVPDCAGANEYLPGQGIAAHKDIDSGSTRTVAIVSLGSTAVMRFTRMGHADHDVFLAPLSLLVMQGEARTRWFHAIAGRHADRLGGVVMPRSRRVSLIFRGA